MSDPPKNAQAAAAAPLSFQLKVIKANGDPIEGAKAEIAWDFQNPYDDVPDTMEVTTDQKGIAVVPVVDPGEWGSKTEATGTLKVSKPHHGPVSAPNAPHKQEAATIRVRYDGALATIEVMNPPVVEDVRWGAPRVLLPQSKTLEVMLVEGGSMGQQFANVMTRALDATQIDQELLFHIACGNLALAPSTDFVIEHDLSKPECVWGNCKVTLGALSKNDPVFTSDEVANLPKYTPKLQVRHGVFGGLRAGNLTDYELKEKGPNGTELVHFTYGGV